MFKELLNCRNINNDILRTITELMPYYIYGKICKIFRCFKQLARNVSHKPNLNTDLARELSV